MRWAFALALSAMMVGVAGCGGDNLNGGVGAGGDNNPKGIPDGFIQNGCSTNDDCNDGNPCTVDTCDLNHNCAFAAKDCSALNSACAQGTCSPTDGSCSAMPANDSQACSTSSGDPGQCMQGACATVPQCYLGYESLDCSTYSATTDDSTSGASVLDTYSCATGETGPEMAYPFRVTTDRSVTVSLTNTTVDLDLIVLEGTNCISSAPCAGHATTAGTGNETVTFMAKGNTDYVIVVEGRGGAMGSYTLNIGCMGGVCMPIKSLACNMTYVGNTTGAQSTSVISSYDCDPSTPGPEDTYRLTQATDTNYNIKLTGMSSDLDLVVVWEESGECDPTLCKASNLQTGTTDESVSFQGYSTSTYDVIVDSKTTGGPYQLEVDCPPSCYQSGNSMDCDNPGDSRSNDDATASTKVVDSWACDPNTTGPEVVYGFSPTVSGMYTFDLTGLSADLDLIVVEGDYATCDPTTACVAQGITAGTANESVSFMADSTKYYYIAVDGKNGAVSPYTLKMRSASCPAPDCYNGANTLSCSYLEDTRSNNDATHSKNAVDSWACDAGTTGPEVVYPFSPDKAGSYTVTLDGLTADLDLIVTAGTSSYTCDSAAACVQSSKNSGTASESVTFTADTSHTYYIAVDGKNGAIGNYHIKLSSSSCGAATCQDGFDSLSCSSRSTSTRNDASGATSDVSTWQCSPVLTGLTGPEFAHAFTPSGAGPYTVQMIGLKADLDLAVIEQSASGTCDPTATCVAGSSNPGTANESVTFTANPAKSYYFVVDGKNGATSPYTLAITNGCP